MPILLFLFDIDRMSRERPIQRDRQRERGKKAEEVGEGVRREGKTLPPFPSSYEAYTAIQDGEGGEEEKEAL